MAHANYTVTSTSITADTGTQVNLTTPTVTLTITADPGYLVTHTDFTVGDVLPSEVTSAVFSQNGAVVECLLTLDNSFIMPSADVNLPIDIDGFATLIQYFVAGTYEIASSNTNLASNTSIPYSGAGNVGDVLTLFTLTFTADADHIFEVDPAYTVYLTNTLPLNYSITRVDTLDGNNKLIQVVYTVKYTLTALFVAGERLKFEAQAIEILNITTPEYYSYIFRDFDGAAEQNTLGEYFMDYAVSMHLLQVFGDVGAAVTITMTSDADGIPVVLYNAVTIDNPVGYRKFEIDFPLVTVDTVYTIALSGDIDAGFVQANPIIVYAGAGNSWTIDNNALTDYTVVRSGKFSLSGFSVIDFDEQINYSFFAKFEVTKDDGSKIKLLRTPSWDDISNLDPALNGGTVVSHAPSLSVTGDGTTTITIEVIGAVTTFGNSDVISYLSLTGLFNQNPVAADDFVNVDKGGVVSIDALANDTDADGHDLTLFISTQPLHGTAVLKPDGNIKYTHDGSENYTDSFEYVAQDGYIASNVATVHIGVGLAAGDSLQLSATDGIFNVPVIVGEAGGEFTVHFDAGAIPDRVQLIYEGNIVADTLFIGDDLTDAGRAAAVAVIEGTTSLNSFDYVGSGGNGTSFGKTAAWQLETAGNTVSYTEAVDIAPTGNVRGVTSNYGNQVGVGDLVYTSDTDVVGTTGLDSADGNASVSYVKASGGSSTITVKVTGIAGTGWSIYQTSMV